MPSKRKITMQVKRCNKVSWRRLLTCLILPVFLLSTTPLPAAFAQNLPYKKLAAPPPPAMPPRPITKGPTSVTVFKPKLAFSANPTDLELTTARIFPEPLIPMNSSPVFRENQALARALQLFKAKNNLENVSDLTNFISAYPHSRWRPSLELNIGFRRYETGYITDALTYWQSAWEGAKAAEALPQKSVADEAVSNLMLLDARLGRTDELQKYFSEIEKRSLHGSVEEKIGEAREGLWCMQHRPDIAYKCGPFALNSILNLNKKMPGRHPLLEKAQSTKQGTSLAQLKTWAQQVGLNYQAAKRSKGASIIVPSVMHWKAGHFAAITAHKNNRYQIKDPTFGTSSNLWITQQALESQTNGYFLVPAGTLPSGWHPISNDEAQSVWGKGSASMRDQGKTPNTPRQDPGPGGDCNGMAKASVFSMQATLNIMDTPISYKPPIGPSMDFLVNYNYLEGNQPSSFSFTNLGADWSFNWVSYLTLDASQNATVMVRGGGYEVYNYTIPDNVSNPYPPNLVSQAVLTIASAGVYYRQLPDGSTEIYNQPDGTGRIFLTQVIDPHGNSASIQYNVNFRVSTITDAIGHATNLSYVSNSIGNAGYYKISQITDPFSRTCSFTYDATTTLLLSITDVIGLTSSFIYNTDSSLITLMTTPYGSTSFFQYTPNDPLNLATGLRFAFPDGTSAVIENWLGEIGLTYFWDREAAMLYPYDPTNQIYTNSKQTHWLYDTVSGAFTEIPVIDYVLPPLENKISYGYTGQSGGTHTFTGPSNLPNQISRIISGGTTQTWNYQYNTFGHVTQSVDPVGRTFTYKYAANNVDLLEKRQTQGTNNDLNGKWEYNNSQHVPNTYIDGSGQKTQYTYNSFGELQTLTDANSSVWTLTYNGNGYLTQIQGPLSGSNDITTFAYDGYGRLYTVTDSEGYVLTYSYDNANRLTQVTYPDGTFEQTVYDKLDAVLHKDRIGRWTQDNYTSMDQLAFEIDPLSRKTQYSWCACGSLAALTDPAGRTTSWQHDLEGRVIEKTYPDNTTTNYTYDTVSRLSTRTDALNQTTTYAYNLDNTLSQSAYTNAVNPTSTVNYSYDPNYLRLSTCQNGWGTLTYNYNAYATDPYATPITGGGMLSSVSNNVISNSTTTYTYDALGRTTNRSINSSSNSTTWTYDAISRITAEANPLGSFSYSYVDNVSGSSKGVYRLSSIGYPNSQTTNFNWYGNTGDQRLQQITNLNPSSATLSQFNYAYDPAGEITQWQQQQNSNSQFHNFSYDLASQVIGDQVGSGSPLPPYGKQFYYNYDSASNRTAVQKSSTQTLRIGGTKTTGDTLTVTVVDPALSGGQQAVTYTVLAGDTLTTIASGLAAAISANANLITLGVNADSNATTIKIKSVSANNTTYTQSTSVGATETMAFGIYANGVENAAIGGTKTTSDTVTIVTHDAALSGGQESVTYTVLAGDTLTSITTGLKAAINADVNLQNLGVTATSAGTVVSITSTSTNYTSYTRSTSVGATETITLSANNNIPTIAAIGGTKTTGDVLTLSVFDPALSGGTESVTYAVLAGDTLTSIATGLKAAINADSNLQAIGVTATSASTNITIQSNSLNLTSYRKSTNAGATETISLFNQINGTQTAVIGGTKTTGNTLTITVYDAGLTGGTESVTYTVLSTDTLTSIASGLASAINADVNLQAINVSATSVSTVVNIKSASVNATTYTQSTNAGATETISLGTSTSVVQSIYNNVNELTNIAAGGGTRFQATTTKPVKSASVATQVISISATPANRTTYAQSTSTGATETISFGTNINGNTSATIGGTKTTGDILTITTYNASLTGGQESVSYTVLAGDNLTSIATGLKSALNADTHLQAIGLSAVSASAVITISVTGTTYTQSTSGGATETITLGINNAGNTTATIGGTKTTGDTLTITAHNAALSGGQESVTYTVLSTDTLVTIAAGLAAAINVDTHLQALGVTGTSTTAATLSWSESFTANPSLSSGANSTNVSAIDGGNNSKTNTYQVSVSNSSGQTLTYDANGNLTNDGTNTYQWDAENRMIQINYPGSGNNSQFTYDGLGHCVKIVETSGGTTTSTKQFVWCGNQMCEARNASSTIIAQYFRRGQTISGTSYYYTKDRLGSIREMNNSSGVIQSQYDYDPYGQVTKLQGSLASDFQYAGYYYHAPSGLNLTVYRAYSASLSRWINRDPIEERGGLNLYAYVGNEPIGETDPAGTQTNCKKGKPNPPNPQFGKPRGTDNSSSGTSDNSGGGGNSSGSGPTISPPLDPSYGTPDYQGPPLPTDPSDPDYAKQLNNWNNWQSEHGQAGQQQEDDAIKKLQKLLKYIGF